MKAILIKDYLVMRKQVLPVLGFFGLYFVIALTTGQSSILAGMLLVFSATFPISSLSYDEKTKWDQYAITTPLKRETLVISKYVMGVGLMGIGGVFAFIANMVIGGDSLMENISTLAVLILVGSIMVGISLPGMYKFGVEHGRMFMIGATFIPVSIIALMSFFSTMDAKAPPVPDQVGIQDMESVQGMDIGGTGMDISSLDAIFESGVFVLCTIGVAVIITVISMLLSIKIFNNKEF